MHEQITRLKDYGSYCLSLAVLCVHNVFTSAFPQVFSLLLLL